MKSVFLLVLAVQAALAMPTGSFEEDYPRFIQMPDDDGELLMVDLEEQPDLEAIEEYMRNPNNNHYVLFTRKNPTSSQILQINNANSISSSNFNSQSQTVVIVHGWHGNKDSNINGELKNAYLKKSDVNVIVLDWSGLAGSTYNTAVKGAPAVGRGLGQFLAFLNKVSGAAYNNMHIIGHSLGAHIVGNAGREVGGRIARVTGLDPAGPKWKSNSDRLGRNDGVYVEAIHTNGGGFPKLGIGMAVAKADFFANGGKSQPGCGISVTCSHTRAWQLFSSTVTYNRLVGKRCNNMDDVGSNRCNGASLNMGNDNLNKYGNGIYRVNTGSKYPF